MRPSKIIDQGFKINIQESENEIPKTIPFTLAAKRIKYLGISLISTKHYEN